MAYKGGTGPSPGLQKYCLNLFMCNRLCRYILARKLNDEIVTLALTYSRKRNVNSLLVNTRHIPRAGQTSRGPGPPRPAPPLTFTYSGSSSSSPSAADASSWALSDSNQRHTSMDPTVTGVDRWGTWGRVPPPPTFQGGRTA